MSAVDDLRERLRAISEELADLAIDSLRESVEQGAANDRRERVITRARRAVDKAEATLGELD